MWGAAGQISAVKILAKNVSLVLCLQLEGKNILGQGREIRHEFWLIKMGKYFKDIWY